MCYALDATHGAFTFMPSLDFLKVSKCVATLFALPEWEEAPVLRDAAHWPEAPSV